MNDPNKVDGEASKPLSRDGETSVEENRDSKNVDHKLQDVVTAKDAESVEKQSSDNQNCKNKDGIRVDDSAQELEVKNIEAPSSEPEKAQEAEKDSSWSADKTEHKLNQINVKKNASKAKNKADVDDGDGEVDKAKVDSLVKVNDQEKEKHEAKENSEVDKCDQAQEKEEAVEKGVGKERDVDKETNSENGKNAETAKAKENKDSLSADDKMKDKVQKALEENHEYDEHSGSESPNTPANATSSPGKRKSSVEKLAEGAPEVTGKRTRKSVASFEPTFKATYTHQSSVSRKSLEGIENMEVNQGRGTVLKDLTGVVEAITAHAAADAELLSVAHRVLYGGRGKFKVITGPKKMEALQQSVLKFSGFLCVKDGKSEDELKKLDEHEMSKFADRLHKWPKDTLIDLCHFFTVDISSTKGESLSKDDVLERLLVFLGNPKESLCSKQVRFRKRKGGSLKKKSARSKTNAVGPQKSKKKSAFAEHDTDTDDEDSDEEQEKDQDPEPESAKSEDEDFKPSKKKAKQSKELNGKMPSDDEISTWVTHYVGCFDLNQATTNHAMQTATDRFRVDLKEKKIMIKDLLKAAIFKELNKKESEE